MTPAARLSSAILLLDEILQQNRPLSLVLQEWGKANRYAGSGDRNAVGNLVHDALRVRASALYLMGEKEAASAAWEEKEAGAAVYLVDETEPLNENEPTQPEKSSPPQGRTVLLGMLRLLRKMEPEAIAALCNGERFAPPPLSAEELQNLQNITILNQAPACVQGDYPAWLEPHFVTAFGETRIQESQALATRAPLDLRINPLKLIRPKALEALGHLEPIATPLSPWGLRIGANKEGRVPYVQAEPAYLKGAVEVQDEGSQLVSLLCGVQPGMQVLDLCAGGGGKTLALGAMMNNRGQVFATDRDQRRLAPIHERLERAGLRNVQVRTPKGDHLPLEDLENAMDLVLVDAPCTGTGTWRRHPDAKWRIRPTSLALRCEEQRDVLTHATRYVKCGGRLVYITCSFLDAENGGQIAAFLQENADFRLVDPQQNAADCDLEALQAHQDNRKIGLLLTPHRTQTDGFFIAVLERF